MPDSLAELLDALRQEGMEEIAVQLDRGASGRGPEEWHLTAFKPGNYHNDEDFDWKPDAESDAEKAVDLVGNLKRAMRDPPNHC